MWHIEMKNRSCYDGDMTKISHSINANERPYWSNELSGRFRLIASLLYLGALGAHLLYVWRNDCGFAFITKGPEVYGGLLLGMLIFEFWAHQRYGNKMTRQVGIWLIAVRIVMYEVAVSMDCTSFATILYMLLPFLTYIFINKWAAFSLSALFIAWTAFKVGAFRCPDCPLDERITPLILLAFGMLWSTAMGGIIQLMESNRVRMKKLLANLEHSHRALKHYAARIEEFTALEERNRIARDIHDSVGHSLAVVNVQLENALVYQDHDAVITRKAVQNAQNASREALRDVRKAVRTLRETSDFFSLTSALTSLTEQSSNDSLQVELEIQGDESEYTQSALMVLYRTAQEGLTNIYKHAEATYVKIKLNLGISTATLEIEDNGRGFDPKEVENLSNIREGHYGLQGIRERLQTVGGDLKLKSSASSGSLLSITLPKQKPEEMETTDRERGVNDNG
jgi:signal transduction histidine kinase